MKAVPDSGTDPAPSPALPWIEISLLGTFEVTVHLAGPTLVPVHLTQQAMLLLACLALHDHPHARGRAAARCSRSTLIRWLYPDFDIADGRKQLSQALYELRSKLNIALNPATRADARTKFEFVVTEADAIGLARQRVLVDVGLFEADAQSPHINAWQRAIQRYRGELMMDLDLDWANERREALAGAYQALLQKTYAALAQTNSWPDALETAKRWLRDDSLSEAGHRAFMQASARLGRYAAALKHFDAWAQHLRDELDLPVDGETHRLAEHIREESQMGWDETASSQRNAEPPFIGRRQERFELLQAAEGARNGAGQLILLEGESGIGKSRLLQTVASGAMWRGLQVIWGHGEQHSTGQLYAPLPEALQHALTPARRDAVRAKLPAMVVDILAHFVPAFAPTAAGNAAGEGAAVNLASISEAGLRLTAPADAIRTLLAELTAIEPHLLILDDVQWADAGFWEVIRALAPTLTTQRLSILLSYRDEELRENTIAWAALRELDQVLHPNLIHLTGLTPKECTDLALALRKTVTVAEAAHLHQQTHGNPLFIEGWVEGKSSAASFQKQFALKLAQLPAPTRHILEGAAVLGREFNLLTWQALVQADVLPVVPTLVAARFIQETSHGYSFRHDMLREQIYAAIDPARRRELHHRSALILGDQGAEHSRLALHWEYAGHWRAAIRAYRNAGDQAESADAHASALQHYEHAFRLLHHLNPNHARLERIKLLCRRQLVYGMQLHLDDWRADIDEIEQLAESRKEKIALITALEARMTLSLFASNPEGTREAGERALSLATQAGNAHVQARIRNILGMHLAGLLRQVDRALILLRDAVAYAEAANDGPLLVSALCNLSMAQRLNGEYHMARESAQRALTLSQTRATSSDKNNASQAAALHALGCALAALHDWHSALAALTQAVQAQFDLNNLWRAAEALASLAHLHIGMGQHDAALAVADRMLKLGQAIGVGPQSDVWNWVQSIRADAYVLSGRADAARDLFERSIDTWLQVTGDSRYALIGLQAKGRWLLEQDRPRDAQQLLKRAHHLWQQRNHAELEPVLLYALAAHRAGERATARDVVTEVTRYAQSRDALVNDIFLQSATHEVCGDVAALLAAHTALQSQARVLNTAAREAFIANVPLHREVIQQVRMLNQTQSAQHMAPREALAGLHPVRLARAGVPLGRPLTDDDMTDVLWTLNDPGNDTAIQQRLGKAGLRHHRILRLTHEAEEQGGVPTFRNLADALGVNVRTIERDVLRLRQQGHDVPTRRDTRHDVPRPRD